MWEHMFLLIMSVSGMSEQRLNCPINCPDIFLLGSRRLLIAKCNYLNESCELMLCYYMIIICLYACLEVLVSGRSVGGRIVFPDKTTDLRKANCGLVAKFSPLIRTEREREGGGHIKLFKAESWNASMFLRNINIR